MGNKFSFIEDVRGLYKKIKSINYDYSNNTINNMLINFYDIMEEYGIEKGNQCDSPEWLLCYDVFKSCLNSELNNYLSSNSEKPIKIINDVSFNNGKVLKINLYEYGYSDKGGYETGTKTTINNLLLPNYYNETGDILQQVLEHLGYKVEITVEDNYEN